MTLTQTSAALMDYQSYITASKLLLPWHPVAEAIWSVLVINRTCRLKNFGSRYVQKEAGSSTHRKLHVVSEVFSCLVLVLLKRTVMSGLLVHSTVAHVAHREGYSPWTRRKLCEMITLRAVMSCCCSGNLIMIKAVPPLTELIGVQRHLMHDRWRRRRSQWCVALLAWHPKQW